MTDAIVDGATGQDGALLSRILLDRGYSVAGSYRTTSAESFWRLEDLGVQADIDFFEYSIGAPSRLSSELRARNPEMVFFTAGDSFTASSQNAVTRVMGSNLVGCAEQVEALRDSKLAAKAVFFGSSEVFGYAESAGLKVDEETPKEPANPYGWSKAFAGSLLAHYRRTEDMPIYEAILFPHESQYRAGAFVVKKIVRSLVNAKYESGPSSVPVFGNLESTRDWGSARQYMEWLIDLVTGSAKPDAYAFATGVSHSVRDVFRLVSGHLGISLVEQRAEFGPELVDSETGRTVAKIEARELTNAGHGYVGSTAKLFAEIGNRRPQALLRTLEEMVVAEVNGRTPEMMRG